MAWRSLAQIIVLGGQLIGRAFSKAFKEELAASRAAAERYRSANTSNTEGGNASAKSSWGASADSLQGITLQEAQQILNIKELDPELIVKNYDHLFAANDKSKGGSLYLQSKVVRAKERIDYELDLRNPKQEADAPNQQKTGEKAAEPPKKE